MSLIEEIEWRRNVLANKECSANPGIEIRGALLALDVLIESLRTCDNVTGLEPESSNEACANSLTPNPLEQRIRALEEALREIAKGYGSYNRDPLIHCGNAVREMR